MNFDEREVLTFEADFETYEEWVEDNRIVIMTEMVKACEEVILDELDQAHVVNVKVVTPIGWMMQVFKVYREDIPQGLEKIMEHCIDKEAYELAAKVKEIQDYIEDEVDDLQL